MAQLSNTALLVMDFQVGIVERVPNGSAELLATAQKAIDEARQAAAPIIYVVVKFRPDYPEISANNKSFSAIKTSGYNFDENSPATVVHDAVAPKPGDIMVTKRRVGAFSGSDLDVVLRSLEIKSLVLAGISTSGVVLSTVRAAADLDYGITVLSDACADPDQEVHTVLMDKIFARQADVITVDEWIGSLT